jgi:ClpP class serine protease
LDPTASYNLTTENTEQKIPFVKELSKIKMEKSYNATLQKLKSFLVARCYPAGRYLRKMQKGYSILEGLPLKESRSGQRIAIINAVGGIASGKSSNGVMGRSLGSDTVIELVRRARLDPSIRGVVLRVDSPVSITILF